MSVWLIAGIVVYLAGSVWLGCCLKRRAAYEARIHERLHELSSGAWDPRA